MLVEYHFISVFIAVSKPTLKNCSSPITGTAEKKKKEEKKVSRAAGKFFFCLIQTKYYFLFQVLPST